jgi:hypothetical protein
MWWRRLRWLLGLIALSALATCPIGWRACRKEAREREADRLLAYLAAQATRVHTATKALPRTAAGPTPDLGSCCKRDNGQCPAKADQWDTAGWRALAFTVDDPHRYSYAYAPLADGGALLQAIGDVDCDGVAEVVEVRLATTADGTLAQTWTRP